MNTIKKQVFLLLLICGLVLCGCAAKAELSSGTVTDDIETIAAVVTPGDLEILDGFASLTSASNAGR